MKIIAKEWLNYAERDLQDAGLLYGAKSYKNCILHCHQAIEKLLKAIIIQKGYQLIRTHDLISLTDSAKLELPESVMDFIGQLNPHYLPVKYPDVTLKFSYTKAKVYSILNKTKEVFRWLRLESSRKT
jgi:HEPN domain-containing protein